MSLLQNLTDGREKPRGILAARGGRVEYWAWVAGTMVAGALLSLAFQDTYVGFTLSGWLVLLGYIRRFHDLGLSGWWAIAMRIGQSVVAALAVGLLGAVIGGWVALFFLIAPVLALGAIPGERAANEFGPGTRRGRPNPSLDEQVPF